LINFEVVVHLFISLILEAHLTTTSTTMRVSGDIDDEVVSVLEMDLAELDHESGNIDLDGQEEIKHIFESYPRVVTDFAGNEVTISKASGVSSRPKQGCR
jgi:hypothetical protein